MARQDQGSRNSYTDGGGETFALDTADAIARAAADLGTRVARVEAAEARGSADPKRIERIEHVVGRYFGSELADYDAAHADE